jgi:hypothetical protein
LEDLTNSDINLFSINDNKITDQFLLDTTRLCNEGDDLNKINENKNFNHNKNEKDGLNYIIFFIFKKFNTDREF